VFVQKVVHCFK